jgi:hypothetical protein
MTQEAYRLAVDFSDLAAVIKHNMRIKVGICFLIVTLKTDRPSVSVRPASKEFRGSFTPGSAVHFMTGQAPHLAVESGKRRRTGRQEQNRRMVVLLVVMTGQAEMKVGSRLKQQRRLRLSVV